MFKDEFSHTIIHNKRFFDNKGNYIKPVAPKEEDPKTAQYNKYVNYIQNCIETEDNSYAEENDPAELVKKKVRAD